MPRGSAPGERRGGRVRGVPNHANQNRQAKAAQEGILPLDVLLGTMRFHHEIARQALEAKPPDLVSALKALKAACEPAKDAAPYIHPRLASTEVKGDPEKPIVHRTEIVFRSAKVDE